MSQIKPSLTIIALTAVLALSGCGDKNPQAVFNSDSGEHLSGWSTGHKIAGKANVESCFGCHGTELDGGISKVSCKSCHLGSDGSIHPANWGSYAYARHSAYVTTNGTTTCANAACHGTTLAGVTGSGPSCATKCHLGGTDKKHPSDWASISSHKTYVNTVKSGDLSSCKTAVCHGTDLKGVFLSGNSCTQCHLGGDSNVHPATAGSWRNTDHKGYTLPGQTITQTRARCDIAECHGTYNDATKPGQIKVDKTCAAGSCHAGDKN